MSSAQNVANPPSPPVGGLRRGNVVRVRPAADILADLDEHGDTDQMPFMPEMLPMCGKTFTVHARADKTCDSINMVGCTREMSDTVHLVGARCDGSAHGGCQAGCLLFFKESWLERVDNRVAEPTAADVELTDLLESNTMTSPDTYRCQATQVLEASRPLDDSSDKHWLNDLRTRNVPMPTLIAAFGLALFNKYQRFSQRFPKWLRIDGGRQMPMVEGFLKKTPTERLDLRPGEWVEVKSKEEIMATLDENGCNRGLSFNVEMLRYCGRKVRVARRVDHIINEKTGRMMNFKSDCIVLEDGYCVGTMHKLCPRAIYDYWREIWLRRVEE
jgi:hypothetical protein